jgi:phage-related protein
MNEKLKDILIRAFKTFWQGAAAALVVALPEIIELIPSGWAVLQPVAISAGIGAIAAGLSTAWNGVAKPALDKMKAKGGDSTVEGE